MITAVDVNTSVLEAAVCSGRGTVNRIVQPLNTGNSVLHCRIRAFEVRNEEERNETNKENAVPP
jgi:hypothetical protein